MLFTAHENLTEHGKRVQLLKDHTETMDTGGTEKKIQEVGSKRKLPLTFHISSPSTDQGKTNISIWTV